ncbi:MAG: redoxin domain-containing protein, partial [Steroidobacteraceae bacterium]|nr:redoxin domain-containing protein [Steroidobacteraceae bacterium]
MFVMCGQLCPICKSYLAEIEQRREAMAALGVCVAAVSADSQAQTRLTAEASKVQFALLYGMDEATMRRLGAGDRPSFPRAGAVRRQSPRRSASGRHRQRAVPAPRSRPQSLSDPGNREMSRLQGIRACVFDAYGTIFDFASAAAR